VSHLHMTRTIILMLHSSIGYSGASKICMLLWTG
jgi:hypothetical protein